MTGDPDPTLDKLRLLNTEVKERLGRQSESSSKIDTKATTMLGFSVALGAFIASQAQLDWWRLIPLILVIAACYFAWRAMDLRDYSDTPEPRSMFVEQFVLGDRTEVETLRLLIKARVMDFDDNTKLHKAKADSWNWCIASLTLGAAGALVLLLLIGAPSHA